MKQDNSRYLYATGLATGILMALISMVVVFKMLDYVEKGQSYWPAIGLSILVSVVFGAIISFWVQRFFK